MAWDSADLYEGSSILKTQCTASSEYSATYPATKAFDGATSTDVDDCWISTSANPPAADGSCYLDFDFDGRRLTLGLQLRRRDTGADCRNFPSSVRILSSPTGLFSGEETDCGTYAVNSADDGAWSDEINLTTGAAYSYLRVEILGKWDRYLSTPQDYVCVKEVRFRSWETLTDVEAILPDIHSTMVDEVTGTSGDYGYIGQTYENRQVCYYREHKHTTTAPEFTFGHDENGNLTVASSVTSKGYGWFFCVLTRADIDGWTIRLKGTNDGYSADGVIQCLIYDGAYTASSSTDFPDAAVMATKGNGLLQTIFDAPASGRSPDLEETIDVSGGSETYCTLFFGIYDNWNGAAVSATFESICLLSHATGFQVAEGFAPTPGGVLNLKAGLEVEGFAPTPSGNMALASGSLVMEGFAPTPFQTERECRLVGFAPTPTAEMALAGRVEMEGFCPTPTAEMRGGSRLEGFCPTPSVEMRIETVGEMRMEGYCPTPTAEIRGGSRMDGFAPTPSAEIKIEALEEIRMEGFCPTPTAEMETFRPKNAAMEGFCPVPFGRMELRRALTMEGFCPTPSGSMRLASSESIQMEGFCPTPSAEIRIEGDAGEMYLEGFCPVPFGQIVLETSEADGTLTPPENILLVHRRGV